MARPRNEELRGAIADAAADLFHERGYDAASYALIAERCGVTRALVQYHWPKKEMLAIAAMTGMLESAIADLGLPSVAGEGEGSDGTVGRLVAIGSAFFNHLLADAGWRRFLLDILASRDLTEQVLVFNAEWAGRYIGREPGEAALDEVAVGMGGFYELMYRRLRDGRPFEVEVRLRDVVRRFLDAMGE